MAARDGAHSLVRDEGAAAEVLLVDEERGHPGEGVRGGLLAAHDLGVGARQAALTGQAGGELEVSKMLLSILNVWTTTKYGFHNQQIKRKRKKYHKVLFYVLALTF